MKKKGMLLAGLAGAVLITGAAVSGTYAKYTTTFDGNGTAQVAKWAIKADDKDKTSFSTVTFTAGENENVATGKFAPGVTLTGEVPIDLTGTEVSVKLDVDTDDPDNGLKKKIIDELNKYTSGDNYTTDDINVGVQILDYQSGPVSSGEIKLSEHNGTESGFTGNDAKYTVKITITWTDAAKNNAKDTKVGEAEIDNITIPVSIVASQITAGA